MIAASSDHLQARRWMQEVKQTSNPVRLLVLAWNIRESLERALAAEPENLEVRLDLLRFHTVTPRLAGGDPDAAREQMTEIARRDASLGHFARGYVAYRDKDFGLARGELRRAIETARTESTRILALRWLGWLSQESQQYADAFATFEQLRRSDASALYEIGRTSLFCSCELTRGKAAVEEYIRSKRTAEMPTLAAARLQLGLLHEKLGDLPAARREVELAWRLERDLEGVAEAKRRLNRRR